MWIYKQNTRLIPNSQYCGYPTLPVLPRKGRADPPHPDQTRWGMQSTVLIANKTNQICINCVYVKKIEHIMCIYIVYDTDVHDCVLHTTWLYRYVLKFHISIQNVMNVWWMPYNDTPLCVSGQNMSATNWRVEIIWDSSDKIMETCGKLGLGLMTNVSVEASFLMLNACHLKKLQQKQLKKLKLRNATCEVKFFRRLRVHTIPRVHYIGDCRNVLKTFPESLRLNPQRKVLKQEDFLRFLKRFLPRWRGLNWKKMSSSSRARYRNLWQ